MRKLYLRQNLEQKGKKASWKKKTFILVRLYAVKRASKKFLLCNLQAFVPFTNAHSSSSFFFFFFLHTLYYSINSTYAYVTF